VPVVPTAVATQVIRREEDPMPTTPQVGRRAPSFTLTDTRGDRIRLSEYRGQKNVLLVFNRGFR